MFYLGVDIVDVDRIRKNLINYQIKFLNKIFTLKEIEYCNSKSDPAIHFAGRFAAKEAVKKAILSSGLLNRISMKKIEIISVENIPKVTIDAFVHDMNISISHTNALATATAIFNIDKKY